MGDKKDDEVKDESYESTPEIRSILERFNRPDEDPIAFCESKWFLGILRNVYWLSTNLNPIYVHMGPNPRVGSRYTMNKQEGVHDRFYLRFYLLHWCFLGRLLQPIRNTWLGRLIRRKWSPNKPLCPWLVIASISYTFIAIFKANRVAGKYLAFERFLDMRLRDIRVGANRTEHCAFPSDIIVPFNIWNQARIIKNQLEDFGAAILINNDLASFGLYQLVMVTLLNHFGSYVYQNTKLALDGFRFSLHPVQERARVKEDLRLMLNDILRRSEHRVPLLSQMQLRETSEGSIDKLMSSADQSSSSRFRQRYDRLAFLRLIKYERIVEQVMPASVSLAAHKKLVTRSLYLIGLMMLVTTILSFGCMIVMIFNDLLRRIESRVGVLKCKQWDPSATLIEHPPFLEHLSKPEEVNYYAQYLNGTRNKLQLAFNIERPKLFYLRAQYLSFLQMTVCFIIIAYWICPYFYITVNSFIGHRMWVDQLSGQLTDCLKLITYYGQMRDPKPTGSSGIDIPKSMIISEEKTKSRPKQTSASLISRTFNFNLRRILYEDLSYERLSSLEGLCLPMETTQIADISDTKLTPLRQDLERCLTISYLNFEFFRRQQIDFQALQNFFATHLASMVLSVFAIGYYTYRSLNNQNIHAIWVFTFLLVLILNCYIVACGFMLESTQKIFRSINGLMARASSSGLEMSYAITLWRRQILTEEQIVQAYGISVLGVSFTPANMLTINSSILGFWLLLYRSNFDSR